MKFCDFIFILYLNLSAVLIYLNILFYLVGHYLINLNVICKVFKTNFLEIILTIEKVRFVIC